MREKGVTVSPFQGCAMDEQRAGSKAEARTKLETPATEQGEQGFCAGPPRRATTRSGHGDRYLSEIRELKKRLNLNICEEKSTMKAR